MANNGYPVGQLSASTELLETALQAWRSLDERQVARRVWEKDASLWKADKEIQAKILNRLGWLTVTDEMQQKLDEIQNLVAAVRADGYEYAVLLGMGGSSLCPEVFRLTFGTQPGFLKLFVLDTTDPDTIHNVEKQINLSKTLFVVASKSGGTIETLSHFKYFHTKAAKAFGDQAGKHFIAITDPDTALGRIARENAFRHTFINPADIGGRYSALSFFGLVPAALLGLDVSKLLDWAHRVEQASHETNPKYNPGIWLGGVLGSFGKEGRDKITFVISPKLQSYGSWVEQLIAESTGKEGKGLLPVAGESLGLPEVYGNDRLFVYLRLEGDDNAELDKQLVALQAGHPVIHLNLTDPYQIAAEFFRWELATVVASLFLEINPLDEPNVQESKDNTARLLKTYEQEGRFPTPKPALVDGDIEVTGKDNSGTELNGYLMNYLSSVKAGDYIAIMAYVPYGSENEAALEALRTRLRDTYHVATTLGYGPRFLHSTGQLHKGGANNGVFIQITCQTEEDVEIPGEPYSFGVLKGAQALGDLFSLDSHERRNIRIAFKSSVAQGLEIVTQTIS